MPSDGNAILENAVDDDDLTKVDDDVTQMENSLSDDDLTQVNSSTQVDGDNDMTSADYDVDPLMTQNEQSESLTEHGSMVEDSKKIKKRKLSKKGAAMERAIGGIDEAARAIHEAARAS